MNNKEFAEYIVAHTYMDMNDAGFPEDAFLLHEVAKDGSSLYAYDSFTEEQAKEIIADTGCKIVIVYAEHPRYNAMPQSYKVLATCDELKFSVEDVALMLGYMVIEEEDGRTFIEDDDTEIDITDRYERFFSFPDEECSIALIADDELN